MNYGSFYILKTDSESPLNDFQRVIRIINAGMQGLYSYSFHLSSLFFFVIHFFVILSFLSYRIKIISKVRFYLAVAFPQGDAWIFLIYYIS